MVGENLTNEVTDQAEKIAQAETEEEDKIDDTANDKGGEEEDAGAETMELGVNALENAEEVVDAPMNEDEKPQNSTEQSSLEKAKDESNAVRKEKEPEEKTPTTIRPVRERKTVDRFASSVRVEAVKEFFIEKGRGTPLKDIPNVASKLSKRKIDETLKLLHTILFGRRGKAIHIKSNIARFSGFAWHESEEEQKLKTIEKFEKCTRVKLLEFCDILDIPVARATTRKEQVITKLIDFLVEPHATTAVLLAGKEKSNRGAKQKKVDKHSSTSGGVLSVKRRKRDGSSIKKNRAFESEDEFKEDKSSDEESEDENGNGLKEKSDDDASEQSASEAKSESEDESENNAGDKQSSDLASKEVSPGKLGTKRLTTMEKSSSTPKKAPRTSSSKISKVEDDNGESPKVSLQKAINLKAVKEKKLSSYEKSNPSTTSKFDSKEKAGENGAKDKGKAKLVNTGPTDTQIKDAICEILKTVDYNVATYHDVLKQLCKYFDMDIMPRKEPIKLMIYEELNKLAEIAEREDAAREAAAAERKEKKKGKLVAKE